MADNLESYFKKYLTDDKPGEDNWNVPSDEVWENVSSKLRKEPGIFIPRKLLFIMGGIIIMIILTIFLWPSSAVKNRKTGETFSYETIKKTGKEPAAQTSSSFETTTTTVSRNKKNGKKNILTPEKKTHVSQNNNTIKDDFYPKKNKTFLSNTPKETGLTPHKKNTTTSFSLNENGDFDITEISSRQYNGYIDDGSETVVFKKLQDNKQIKESAAGIKKKEKKSFDNNGKTGLGIFFAPTLTSTFINNNVDNSTMNAGNMFLYSTNWGFTFRYFISNRFTFVMGIEKTEIKSWSKSLVDFNYDASNEHVMPDGEKENTSVIPMPTPFGEITTEITYRFPGEQQFPDGELMQSVLETHQEVKYLSIPAGFEFNIKRFRRFGWFTEAGVQFNRAILDATKFNSQILHQGDEMKVVDEKMATHPNYIRNYLGFYAGTGISYRISKKFLTTSSFRYFGNITPVNFQDKMSTYVQGFNLRIGFVYLLRNSQ